VILISTPFNIEKVRGKFVSACEQASGQRSSNGQNYAIVCPNLTYSWGHSRTALYVCIYQYIPEKISLFYDL